MALSNLQGSAGHDTARTGISKPGVPYLTQFMTLRGGLNNSIHDELIEPDEIADGRNYMPDHLNSGVIIKRYGIAKQLANSQTAAVSSIYQGLIGNFFTVGTGIKQFTVNTDFTAAALTATTAPDWTSMGGMDIVVNGTDAPGKVTAGPAFAVLGGAPPTFKYVETVNNFVWGAGHSTGVLRYSSVGTTETWPAANSLTVTNNSNDDIKGLVKAFDALIVMCAKSFYHVKAWEDGKATITYSNFSEGCASHRSLVNTPFGLFWWSNVGIAWRRDGYSVDYPTMRKIPNTIENLNAGQASKVHGVYHPRLRCVIFYVCSIGSSTEDIGIWYFPADEVTQRKESVWVMTGLGTQASASGMALVSGKWESYIGLIDTRTAPTIYYLEKMEGETDDSTVISAYIKSKRDLTEFGLRARKRASHLEPLLMSAGVGQLSYGFIVDNETQIEQSWNFAVDSPGGFVLGVSVLGTGTLGYGYYPLEVVFNPSRIFRKLQHVLNDDLPYRTRVRGFVNSGTLVSV